MSGGRVVKFSVVKEIYEILAEEASLYNMSVSQYVEDVLAGVVKLKKYYNATALGVVNSLAEIFGNAEPRSSCPGCRSVEITINLSEEVYRELMRDFRKPLQFCITKLIDHYYCSEPTEPFKKAIETILQQRSSKEDKIM